MAHVSGPTHRLPGQSAPLPEGTMCDMHPDRPAVARIVGEVDSFGAEYHDCCAECAAEVKTPLVGFCDWCKTDGLELRPMRDMEEGTCGPVYYVCAACAKKQNDYILREFASDEPDDDGRWDEPDDSEPDNEFDDSEPEELED